MKRDDLVVLSEDFCQTDHFVFHLEKQRLLLRARDVKSLGGGFTNPTVSKPFEWEGRQEDPTSHSG